MASLSAAVRFTEDLDSKYKCSNCKRPLLQDPQQLGCGHRYCRPCIDQLLLTSKPGDRCPACREEEGDDARSPQELEEGMLVQGNVHSDNAIRRDIGKLKCFCPSSESCKWTGLYKDLQDHLDDKCQFVPWECGCGQKVYRSLRDEHTKKDCPERLIECQHCGSNQKAKDHESHKQVCKKRPVVCVGCHKEMAYELLAVHEDPHSGDCSRQYASCPLGCKDVLSHDELNKHKENCLVTHLDATLEKLKEIELQVMTSVACSSGAAAPAITSAGRLLSAVPEEKSGQAERAASTMPANAGPVAQGSAEGASLFATPFPRQPWARTQHGSSTNSGLGGTQRTIACSPGGGATTSEPRSKLSVLEEVIPAMVKAAAVLHLEIGDSEAVVKRLTDYADRQSSHLQTIEEKVKAIERRVQTKETRLVELTLRIEHLEMIHQDGILVWQINDFSKKKKEAVIGRTAFITSHPFYLSPTSYKMCAQAYLNGDASVKGTHLSIFFVLMKGPYDAVLRWPFIQKVTIMLLNQNNPKSHIKESFVPDMAPLSYKRPTEPTNKPVGCPSFILLKDLEDPNRGFLKEDTIFIKLIIEKT